MTKSPDIVSRNEPVNNSIRRDSNCNVVEPQRGGNTIKARPSTSHETVQPEGTDATDTNFPLARTMNLSDEGSGSASSRFPDTQPRPLCRTGSFTAQRRPSAHTIFGRSSCKTRPQSPDPTDLSHLDNHSALARTRCASVAAPAEMTSDWTSVATKRSSKSTSERPSMTLRRPSNACVPWEDNSPTTIRRTPSVRSSADNSPIPIRRTPSVSSSADKSPTPIRHTPSVRSSSDKSPTPIGRTPSIRSSADKSPTPIRRTPSVRSSADKSPTPIRRTPSVRSSADKSPTPIRRTPSVRSSADKSPTPIRRTPSVRSSADKSPTPIRRTPSVRSSADKSPDISREGSSIRYHVPRSNPISTMRDLSLHNHRHSSNTQSPVASHCSPIQSYLLSRPSHLADDTNDSNYPRYSRLSRVHDIDSQPASGRQRKMATVANVTIVIDEDPSEETPDKNLQVDPHSPETNESSQMDEVKHLAARLKLETRRPSVFAWRNQVQDVLTKRGGSGEGEEGASEGESRWRDVGVALQWLRSELLNMQQQDQHLARTLIALRRDIHTVKLQRSYAQHQEILEEAIDIMDERDDMAGELCDDLPDQFSPTLRNCGLTRMNINSRRFSVF